MSTFEEPKAQFVSIDGKRYCYRRSGNGPPILLLHGVTDSSRFFWREFFRHFEHEYAVIAMDLPGHGDSEKSSSGYSAVELAKLVVKFLDRLTLDRPVILGHSLGGIIAARLAVLYPQRVSRLIVCGSPLSGGAQKDLEWISRLPLAGAAVVGAVMIPGLGRLLYSVRSPTTIRWTIKHLGTFSDPSRIPPEMIEEKMKSTYTAVTQSLWQAVLLEDIDKDLHRISVPTLIIRGADDGLVHQKQVEEASAKIPDSRLAIIDDAGHFPLIEQPEAFIRVVAGFLSGTVLAADFFGHSSGCFG